MTVLTRSALEDSPLADLHVIAAELGLDGYRRLRKALLVDAILEITGGDTSPAPEAVAPDEPDAPTPEGDDDADAKPARTRSRRGGSGRSRSRTTRDADVEVIDPGAIGGNDDVETEAEAEAREARAAEKPAAARSRGARGGRSRSGGGNDRDRGGRDSESDRGGARDRDRGGRAGGSGRSRDRDRDADRVEDGADDVLVSGVVELLANGSGFLRVSPPESSDDDVYISAAQVRRCELVSGDTLSGPTRAPRRSERYPSLVRIDTINDKPADEVAEGTPWDELACTYPTERFALGSDDPTLKAIEWLTPIGRGSRVTITGGPRAGKTEALKRLATALAGQEGLELLLVLAGVRPEELADVPEGLTPAAAVSFAQGPDAQAQAVERTIDTAKRIAARGGHAVVLVDSLTQLPLPAARRALAAARAIVDGGSLTVIATAAEPFGGETTHIALDATLTSTGRLPALDLVVSGTLKPELLVGDAGAEAIAQARATALD